MTGPSSSDQNPWLMSNKIRVYLRFFYYLFIYHYLQSTYLYLHLFTWQSRNLSWTARAQVAPWFGGGTSRPVPWEHSSYRSIRRRRKIWRGWKRVYPNGWFENLCGSYVCLCMEMYGVWFNKKMVSHGSHGFTWFTCFFFETDPTLGPKIGRRLDRSQVRNKWNWSILGCALWIGADASHGEVATEVYKTFFAVHE